MESLESLVTTLSDGKASVRDPALQALRERIPGEPVTPDLVARLVDLLAEHVGKANWKYTWGGIVKLLVALGPDAAAPAIPVLRDAMAAFEDPFAKLTCVAYQKQVAARALVALAPDIAGETIAPWLGEPELLLGKASNDTQRTVDYLVELGPRAAALVPALRRWAEYAGPRQAAERDAAREALRVLEPQIANPPPFDPLDPRIASAVRALGGEIAPYVPQPDSGDGIPEPIRRLRDIQWPRATYANKEHSKGYVKYVHVWMLEWLGLHVDAESYDLGWGRPVRAARLAHADGGNYSLHVMLDDDPLNPIVFTTDHDRLPSERVSNGISLLYFLRTLKREKAKKPKQPA